MKLALAKLLWAFFIFVALVAALPGCSQIQAFNSKVVDIHNSIEDKFHTFLDSLVKFTVADVTKAYSLAEKANDTQGMFCWSTVKDQLTKGDLQVDENEGLASKIQRLRNEATGQGPIGKIKEACKPVLDSVVTGALAKAAEIGIKVAPIPIPK